MAATLRSFPPVIDKRSRILILGSIPGPEALRRREYYGFPGNHFWRLTADLLGVKKPESYRARIRLLKAGRIALWDSISVCTRSSALDADIRESVPNDIPGILKRHPKIRAVFVNGRTAEKMLKKHFVGRIPIPVRYLPSSSPANAGISYAGKLKAWRTVLPPLGPNRAV